MASDTQERMDTEYAVYSLHTAIDDLVRLENHIGQYEEQELDAAWRRIQTILERARTPYLRRETIEAAE